VDFFGTGLNETKTLPDKIADQTGNAKRLEKMSKNENF